MSADANGNAGANEQRSAGPNGTMGNQQDIPAIPEIMVPNISEFDASAKKFQQPFKGLINPVKGITVSAAQCDKDGRIINSPSMTVIEHGDGSGAASSGGGSVVNNGDGSGVWSSGSTRIVVHGDGSGVLDDGTTKIVIHGDGSGTYTNGKISVTIQGNGSGAYEDGQMRIVNNGDGSGTYSQGDLQIVNHGDGSGAYSQGETQVVNNGDGSGLVTSPDHIGPTPMDPMPPLPKVGKFPNVKSIKPIGTNCGTLVRLSDQVLFDFDKDTLRPEAGPVLDALAKALAGTTMTIQVNGHTDALGGDAYNLDLSKRRAKRVADALAQRGAHNPVTVSGFGESQPIAPNTVGGKDYPAGRQLNRRVEIVIPSS